ncbi:MAG: orotidine-5'-phosphate decarboxylase [Bacteroidales bacterium]|nr:orotidine-5'-phosphate decarboxylase [Bacteroidales bacterium]
MTSEQLFEQIRLKKSFLCIGLDPDPEKLPAHFRNLENPFFEFNREIIDRTHDLVIAYKPNTAFYESLGSEGWDQLEQTVGYIRQNHPEVFIIADAKRCDIGNTAARYAEAFFKRMDCDAITVSPYMGADSVEPYLRYPGKWIVLLALTSNPGADDFQMISGKEHDRFFETVLKKSKSWGNPDNVIYVIGATRAGMLIKVREIVPEHFLLIPGVGVQGGDLNEVAGYGLTNRCGLIVNVSRSILYADPTDNFASAARVRAIALQQKMENILKENNLM